MLPNNHQAMDVTEDADHDHERGHAACCSPLGVLKSVKTGLSYWWQPGREHDQRRTASSPSAEVETKKYVHVPTHAASSHLSTTASKSIKKANEIL